MRTLEADDLATERDRQLGTADATSVMVGVSFQSTGLRSDSEWGDLRAAERQDLIGQQAHVIGKYGIVNRCGIRLISFVPQRDLAWSEPPLSPVQKRRPAAVPRSSGRVTSC